MKWEGDAKNKSKVRRIMHGSHHFLVGVVKKIMENNKGAHAEFKRAKQQFDFNLKLHHHKGTKKLEEDKLN